MPIQNPFRIVLLTVPTVCAFFLGGPESPRGQETVVPQTAMSLCPALTVTAREIVPAGTAIGVSPDGRYLVQYIHTTQGVELKLRNRDTGEDRGVQLEPPSLPPGVTWQVHEIIFSPSGSLFAVRSVGAIWVLDAETAQVRYQIGVDGEKQAYPGKAALAEGQMAAVFWPPESYLADAVPKKPPARYCAAFRSRWTPPSGGPSWRSLRTARAWLCCCVPRAGRARRGCACMPRRTASCSGSEKSARRTWLGWAMAAICLCWAAS